MPFHQKDIVKVNAPVAGISEPSHPCLIISCEAANGHEKIRIYTGVMVTHAKGRDRFTKEITKDMMETHWKDEWSQIRLHILIRFKESDISRDATHHVGRMKQVDFKSVLEDIQCLVLTLDK
jgi:hypothetical protein